MGKLLAPEVGDHGGQRSAGMPPDPPTHGGEHSFRGAPQGASAGAGGAAPGAARAGKPHMRAEQPQVCADPCRGVPLFCPSALCASLHCPAPVRQRSISLFGSLVAAVVDA
jgi:hypothetical protein